MNHEKYLMHQFDCWKRRIDNLQDISEFRDWFQVIIVGYERHISELESAMQEFVDRCKKVKENSRFLTPLEETTDRKFQQLLTKKQEG